MHTQYVARMIAALAFLGPLAPSQEPVKPPLNPRIITATRQVAQFSALEKQLLQAIQKKDQAALEVLVSDDFTISMPNADPLAGDEWMEQVMGKDYSLKSFVVRQFWATDLGDSAMVVFDRSLQATYKGKPDSGEFFVVDLWKKSGDSWKLVNRCVTKVSSPAASKPLHRPTGKQ
ncbi:MAG TPA: nuclear transport factor 2 family protein [Candidatus Saccharimonadales bacterium]|jgi:ketosteroid isomerase-like protein|nr:nuclear transport factor 2 family protein [Candidatus Saccharimonadales bacterium]